MSLKNSSENKSLSDYLELSKSMLSKPLPPVKQALGATMAIGVLGALQTVDAQIVYSGTQNLACILPGHNSECFINVDNTSTPDLRIRRNNLSAGLQFIQAEDVPSANLAVTGFLGNAAGAYNYPSALSSGATIGGAGPWVFDPTGQLNTLADSAGYPGGQWELGAGTQRFLGIRTTGPRYGWVRIQVNSFGNYTIVDWAINNTINSPINAGQTAPTAAAVSVGGRVFSAGGRAISNATVTITDTSGRILTGRTNGFGFFRIDGVTAGQTVIVSATRKGYSFGSQTLNVSDNVNDVSIVAEGDQ